MTRKFNRLNKNQTWTKDPLYNLLICLVHDKYIYNKSHKYLSNFAKNTSKTDQYLNFLQLHFNIFYDVLLSCYKYRPWPFYTIFCLVILYKENKYQKG